jgi:hypothetical protein
VAEAIQLHRDAIASNRGAARRMLHVGRAFARAGIANVDDLHRGVAAHATAADYHAQSIEQLQRLGYARPQTLDAADFYGDKAMMMAFRMEHRVEDAAHAVIPDHRLPSPLANRESLPLPPRWHAR